jgi:hypothetical protein
MAGGHHEEWGRVTVGKSREERGAVINCHKTQVKEGRGRGRSEAGATGLRRCSTRRGRGRKGEEEGRGRHRQVGPGCQRLKKKEKEEGKAGRCGGKVKRASGLLGRKVRR